MSSRKGFQIFVQLIYTAIPQIELVGRRRIMGENKINLRMLLHKGAD